MPFYRVTLLINSTDVKPPVGLSERYDIEADGDSQALTLGKGIANRRVDFLPIKYTLIAIRVSKLTSFHQTTPVAKWRLRQASMQVCGLNLNGTGTGQSEPPTAGVFYHFHYLGQTGKPSNRIFRPMLSSWWSNSNLVVAKADPAIQSFVSQLKSFSHRLVRISQVDGTLSGLALDCATFQRVGSRRVGRPFLLVRGRRFAHRGTTG